MEDIALWFKTYWTFITAISSMGYFVYRWFRKSLKRAETAYKNDFTKLESTVKLELKGMNESLKDMFKAVLEARDKQIDGIYNNMSDLQEQIITNESKRSKCDNGIHDVVVHDVDAMARWVSEVEMDFKKFSTIVKEIKDDVEELKQNGHKRDAQIDELKIMLTSIKETIQFIHKEKKGK